VPRYRLTLAYDGTDVCGWQKQEPPAAATSVDQSKVMGGEAPGAGRVSLRTVEEVVERAVVGVVREPVLLMGASRTDAGVHARGQVAAFTCSGAEGERGRGWPEERGTEPWMRAINSRLPEDVLVRAAELAPPGFNPIGGAVAKEYTYTLHVSAHRPVWERRYVHHVWTALDVGAMRDAAAAVVGEHDFAAFAAAGHGRLSTVRTVFACTVTEPGPVEDGARVQIRISGNGFLYNMVRIIAGTLVEAGRGRMTGADVRAAIESGDRRRAGPTLAARGLCLEWVRY
jgi:tRNA pseudouridine38-40 synthase